MSCSIQRCAGVLLAALMLVSAGGCNGSAKTQTLRLQVDRHTALGGQSVEVHLVGVNAAELGEWQGNTAAQYWSPGNQLAANAQARGLVKRIAFPADGSINREMVSDSDAIWSKWREWKAMNLFIYAQNVAAQPGGERQVVMELPIDSGSYGRNERVTIQIMGSQITVNPPPKSAN